MIVGLSCITCHGLPCASTRAASLRTFTPGVSDGVGALDPNAICPHTRKCLSPSCSPWKSACPLCACGKVPVPSVLSIQMPCAPTHGNACPLRALRGKVPVPSVPCAVGKCLSPLCPVLWESACPLCASVLATSAGGSPGGLTCTPAVGTVGVCIPCRRCYCPRGCITPALTSAAVSPGNRLAGCRFAVLQRHVAVPAVGGGGACWFRRHADNRDVTEEHGPVPPSRRPWPFSL